jgi:hypothetical protein
VHVFIFVAYFRMSNFESVFVDRTFGHFCFVFLILEVVQIILLFSN